MFYIYTLTFGQKPTEFISRTDQIDKIIHTFDMEVPSNKVFMIAGVRGSGKTISLAEIADHYSADEQWIVLRLSADMDLIAGAVSELTRISQFHDLDLGLEALLRNILEKLKNKPCYLYDNSRLIFILHIPLIHAVFHLLEMVRISGQIPLSHIILLHIPVLLF